MNMNDLGLTDIQKAQFLADEGEEGKAIEVAKGMRSDDSFALIDKLAQQQRRPNEKREQAFDRFTTENVFGQELLAAHLAKRRVEGFRPNASSFAKAAPAATVTKSPALLQLEADAAHLAKMAKLTPEIAFSKLCDTQYGAEMLAKDKEARGLIAKEDDAGGGTAAMEQFTRLARQHASTTGQSMSDSIDAVLRTKAGADLWRAARHAKAA
jgi:hypothetical protein